MIVNWEPLVPLRIDFDRDEGMRIVADPYDRRLARTFEEAEELGLLTIIPPNKEEPSMAADIGTANIHLSPVLDTMRGPALRLPELEDIQAVLPDAHIEQVGDRKELVIYTGWTLHTDGKTLVPMSEHVE